MDKALHKPITLKMIIHQLYSQLSGRRIIYRRPEYSTKEAIQIYLIDEQMTDMILCFFRID